MRGGPGADTMEGNADNDEMYGDGEIDVMRGGAADDAMRGGGGDDLMEGNGNDLSALPLDDSANPLAPVNSDLHLITNGPTGWAPAGGGDGDVIYGDADQDDIVGGSQGTPPEADNGDTILGNTSPGRHRRRQRRRSPGRAAAILTAPPRAPSCSATRAADGDGD